MRHFSNVRRVLVAVLSASMLMSECLGVSAAAIGEQSYIEETPIQEETEIVSEAEETEESQNEETSEELTEEEEVTDQEEITDDETVDEEVSEETTDDEASVSDNSVSDNSVSDNEVKEDEELIGGLFPGLAMGYDLESYQLEYKDSLLEHEDEYIREVPGVHYVEGEIMVEAENREEAEEFAKAFNGTLESFDWNIAVIELNADDSYKTASVMDAVTLSADPQNALPAAFPNGLNYLFDDEDLSYVFESYETEENEEAVESEAEATEEVEEEISEDTVFYDEAGKAVAIDAAPNAMINDPLLKSTSTNYQWQHNLLGSDIAWRAGYRGQNVKVCVIDTGIRASHEEIKGNLKASTGYNSNSNTAVDSNGHGTHVAGIIAGAGNNGKGGSGVAYGASLYTVNVFGTSGTATNADTIKAIRYAINAKVDVINMSLGGPAYNALYENAVLDAYKAGIAVFCAAGNESTNAIAYPAGYKGAISVAAVDKSNKKSFFSNHGGIAFSGPGVGIWSAYYTGDSSYYMMDGTSQATPCIAGAAAVVLSSGKVSGTGSKRVDNLKSILGKGASSSGLGKGTPHLGKCLGLGTTETAPAAPAASVKPGTYNQASVNVVLSAGSGKTIYYTLDGTAISYKNGTISDGAIKYSGTIAVSGKSSVTIKAIAINENNKMASKVASFKYTLKPKVSSIAITPKAGTNQVTRGGSVALVAKITPDYAANKKVKWSVDGNPVGVSVSGSGVVKVTTKATVGNFVVRATALDGSNKVATYRVYVNNSTNLVKTIKLSKKSINTVINKTDVIDVTAVMNNNKNAASAAGVLTAVSADTSIATVTINGNKISIVGKGVGKTVITLGDKSGSGKSATINVNCNYAVTGIAIQAGAKVTAGKSLKPVATVTPKKANQKLNWTLVGFPAGANASNSGVKINASNGTVSTAATAKLGAYKIRATAADGSGRMAEASFTVVAATQKITGLSVSTTALTVFRATNLYSSPMSKQFKFTLAGTSGNFGCYRVTSSNPDLVTVSSSLSGATGTVTVKATGKATGTATITVETTDGSNLKKTCKVTVSNPASGLRIAPPSGRCAYLAQGKVMALQTVVENDFGKLDAASKKLKWSSSNPSVVSVDSNGKVKALRNDGSKATITAIAADGSGVKATYDVITCGTISSMNGYFGYSSAKIFVGRLYKGNAAEVRMVVRGKGKLSHMYVVSVKGGSGLGVARYVVDGDVYIPVIANQSGNYTVTVTPIDGNSGSVTYKIIVP